jgi:hypothetical protein
LNGVELKVPGSGLSPEMFKVYLSNYQGIVNFLFLMAFSEAVAEAGVIKL